MSMAVPQLHLERVELQNNKAVAFGGAVRASGGLVAKIANVTITGITSNSGSISMRDMGDVSVANIDFHHNTANEKCGLSQTCGHLADQWCILGALEVEGASSVELTDLTFRLNTARHHGGALCISEADKARIGSTIFKNNEAGVDGGAVLLHGNKQTHFRQVQFLKNQGNLQGGAIKGGDTTPATHLCDFVITRGVEVKALLIEDTRFERNEAQLRGGAVYMEKSSLEIQVGTRFQFSQVSCVHS